MLKIQPQDTAVPKLHGLLLGAIAPRPICFASTISEQHIVNLSPYSFFNVFSANPPVLIFSPARRVRDNTTKHTLENVQTVKEVVINVVSYKMVQQMSLSSTEYPKGTNEFVKAGFTEVPSEYVKPPRVKEAPVQLECKVTDVIALGNQGGAGNLVLCELLCMHISPDVLDADGRIDPQLLDPVARMGGNWYSRAKEGMFEVPKPLSTLGIGVDALPTHVLESKVLTGNDLGILGNQAALPSAESIQAFRENASDSYQYLLVSGSIEELHTEVHRLISENNITQALTLLVAK